MEGRHRIYKDQNAKIKRLARKWKVKEAEALRRMIDEYSV